MGPHPLPVYRRAILPDADPPPPQAAASWFLALARSRAAAGDRLDADTLRTLMQVAPGDPLIPLHLARAFAPPAGGGLEAAARRAAWLLRAAASTRDEPLARDVVTALESDILRAYRPGCGLGRLEDDIAAAAAMMDAHEIGGQPAHAMMAEELMLGVLQRDWHRRMEYPLALNAEAAITFARLDRWRDEPVYRPHAVGVLRAFAGSYQEHGLGAAVYVLALHAI